MIFKEYNIGQKELKNIIDKIKIQKLSFQLIESVCILIEYF